MKFSLPLFAALLLLVACGQKKSKFSRGAGAGKGTFSESCANPVMVSARAGEKVLPGGMGEATGIWELESVTSHFEFENDGAPGTLTTQYNNGSAAVTCHNSRNNVTAAEKNESTLNSKINLPFVMDADKKMITSEATLKGYATGGVTNQEFEIAQVNKPLPATENATLPSLESQLVRSNAGKLILRMNMRTANDTGSGHTRIAMEAIYKPKAK